MAPTNWQLVAFIGFFAPISLPRLPPLLAALFFSFFLANTYNNSNNNNEQTKTFSKGELCFPVSPVLSFL